MSSGCGLVGESARSSRELACYAAIMMNLPSVIIRTKTGSGDLVLNFCFAAHRLTLFEDRVFWFVTRMTMERDSARIVHA